MNALLEHVWGESQAVDRVWAQVTGMSPRRAVGCPLMVLQAFVDDSFTRDGYYVLGGFVATAETWASFSAAWEELLPLGTLHPKNNSRHFKMCEMAQSPQRMENAGAFFRVIENHDVHPIAAAVSMRDIYNALSRIWSLQIKIDRNVGAQKFMIAFNLLMEGFHAGRDRMEDESIRTQSVDFIFDEQEAEKRHIIGAWDRYLASKPDEIRGLYGATPRFENDQKFLPLQAADFWAWWTRKWYEDGKPDRVPGLAFGQWPTKKPGNTGYVFELDEDMLTENLLANFRMTYPAASFYDSKFAPAQP